MIVGPGSGKTFLIVLVVLSYTTVFAGVEAGRQASTPEEYLEARQNLTSDLEEARFNETEIVEAWNNESGSSEAESYKSAGIDNETAEALSRPVVNTNLTGERPPPMYNATFELINRLIDPAIRWAEIGAFYGYHYPFLSYHILWGVNISVFYASPWLLLAWHRSQKKKAREAVG